MRIGSRALVTEAPHRARLTVLDKNDRLVCALGVNDEVCTMEGFPNSREWQTRQVRHSARRRGRPSWQSVCGGVDHRRTYYETGQNLTRSTDLGSKPTITPRRGALLDA